MKTADGKFAPYIVTCAWWRPPGWRTKGCPQHVFATSNLRKAYCSSHHQKLAKAQRLRDKRLNDGFDLPWLHEPKKRMKMKQKTPIVGSEKYPDEMVRRVSEERNEPRADVCPNCGALTYGECMKCGDDWTF